MSDKRIVIGSDHGGLNHKTKIKEHLVELGYDVLDVGTNSFDSCDYPVYAKALAQKITSGEFEKGILVCGTGIGMSIAANKIKGIRASLCADTFSAHATREHNNSNVLCLGERTVGIGLALEIVDAWLNASYEGGRHQKRVDMFE